MILNFRTRTEARRNGESGLALLDVLLGMAIFALIAVIAVQSMSTFRQRAYVTAATSDASQLATGIESYLTDNAAVPTAITVGAANPDAAVTTGDLGVNLTNNNAIHRYVRAASLQDYSFCIRRMNGTAVDGWAFYNSTSGAITHSGTGTPAAYNATSSPCGA